MRPVFLALGTMALFAQQGVVAPAIPPERPKGGLVDKYDELPLLLGPTSAKAVLAHRGVFRDNLAAAQPSTQVKARWMAIQQPFTVLVVFGSWCSDSQHQLPSLLAFDAAPNPFIELHYLGVNRDKVLDPAAWPQGCTPQKPSRVPTVYVFSLQPGGAQKLVSYVVETPPRAGQTMAEAVLDIMEGPLAR